MKIFILKKKYLYICLICVISFLCLFSLVYHPFSLAVDLTTNSVLSENVKKAITNLGKNNEKIAYLTFDDGPTLKATGKILYILEEENIKATFFVVGKHVKEHPELVKRAYEEGHYIANHGYNHNNSLLYKSSDNFISEIKNTDIEIGNAIGVDNYCSHVFRFPNGFMSNNYRSKKNEYAKLLLDMDYTYIDWNCLNRDSEKKYSNYQLLNNLKKSSKNKGTLVVLMHDTSDVNPTPSVLKDSISYLKSQGYVFKSFYSIINSQDELK